MADVELGDPAYVSLMTFRKSGVAVAVPVWCALEGVAITSSRQAMRAR